MYHAITEHYASKSKLERADQLPKLIQFKHGVDDDNNSYWVDELTE